MALHMQDKKMPITPALNRNVPNVLPIQDLLNVQQISDQFLTVHDRSQLRVTRLNVRTPPGRGCEVYVSNLPRDILMRRFHDFMSYCGDIYELRLLLDFSGYNRGTGYVKYCTKDAAKMASLLLNSCEIEPGYKVTIKMSFDNNMLILSMIPKHVTYEQVLQQVSARIGNGLTSVVLTVQDEKNGKDTCCALLKYETHRHALDARRTLWPGVQLWNSFVQIEWWEAQDLKLARVLYFRNFPENKTRFDLFDFLKKVLNIHTIIKLHVESGLGYIVFSLDKYRKEANQILKDCCVFGRKLELRFKKFYSSSNPKRHVRDNSHVEENKSLISDHQTYFDNMLHNVPVYHTTPVYTKPGIYNELEAIKHVIHNFLHKRFPLKTWTVLDSVNEEKSTHLQVIRVMLIVNSVQYSFLLAEVRRIDIRVPDFLGLPITLR